ncbi:helix-turn-helix transcriptional regulator [Alteromonas facilis]|uniref:helix-turn-helix transcriptional regulator n=1 Tax=Alteromonas facilis TaxID=2048004 RepID=UPI000C294B77|nr:AlpA family phage regulatory protein [Alteromonas facilis]
MTNKRLIRLPEVLNRLPISKSAWWAGIQSGKFPKPVKIGRTSAWDETEINQLITSLKEDA